LPDGPLTRELWLVVHTDIKDVPLIRAVMDELGGKAGKHTGEAPSRYTHP